MSRCSPSVVAVFITLVSISIAISCITFTFQHQEIYNTLHVVEYSEIHNEISENATNILIPSTWEELNEQQFCRMEQSSEYQNQVKYLKFLYNIQFPKDCFADDQKFLIYDMSIEKGFGLGASLLGSMLRFFTASLMMNRTFLLNGAFDWSKLAHYCNGKNGMECYFLPLSNCDPLNILSNINKSDHNIYYEGDAKGPYGNELLTKCNDSYCVKQKVIYINKHSPVRPVKRRRIETFSYRNWNIGWEEYATLCVSFMLRPQPNVKQIVFDKINKSINNSIGINDINKINSSKTISLPIRGSDKCHNIRTITGKKYTHRSEISCFTPIEYVYIMNSIKYLTNNQIENVILTSEDMSFITNVIEYMKNKTYSNVRNWNIILNTEDYSVGEGTTTFKDTLLVYGNNQFTTNETLLFTSFYTDHIISAISSLMLQIHLDTEYFIVLHGSTWTSLMWMWTKYLNCNINNPNKHILKNKKCISLDTPGYQTSGLSYKYVKYPQDLWNKIHNENLNPDKFYNKFNIKIGNQGWDEYCT